MGEAVVLLCSQPGYILARREDLDPLKALQLLQMSIARDEIVRPGFDRTLEEHVIAGILADKLNTTGWKNQEDAGGISKEGEQGRKEVFSNACPLQNGEVLFEDRLGEAK